MLDVVCPGLECFALLLRVAAPFVDGRDAHHLPRLWLSTAASTGSWTSKLAISDVCVQRRSGICHGYEPHLAIHCPLMCPTFVASFRSLTIRSSSVAQAYRARRFWG